MKNILIIFLLAIGGIPVLMAQDHQIQGIVYDRDNNLRLNKVYIYNARTDKGVYNNSKGEFTIAVREGDTIVAALTGYSVGTLIVKAQSALIFYLKRTSIMLQEVVINDTIRISPDKMMEQNREEYHKIYRIGKSDDLFTIGNGGAGLGIDGLYNLISRQGKNARFLQKIIERDYHDAIINYRFTERMVANVTNLSGKTLEDFMSQYRPSYYFVLQASEYAFIAFIRSSYERYLQNPGAYRLPPLKE